MADETAEGLGLQDVGQREYAERCQAAAADFLERSTRFNAKASSFPAASARIVDFDVHVSHELSVEVEQALAKGPYSRQTGRNASDVLHSDRGLFEQTVEAQKAEELARPETREALAAHVMKGGYASLWERTLIRTHPQRLVLEHDCDACRGKGQVECGKCRGRGKVNCFRCNGRGTNNCSACGGSGQESYTVEVSTGGGQHSTESRSRACGSCHGGGSERCTSCGGSGDERCGNCRGSGRVDCKKCDATGRMTLVSSTHTLATPSFLGSFPAGSPDFLEAAVQRLGLEELGDHADISLAQVARPWNAQRVGTAGPRFSYTCKMPVCEMDLRIGGASSRWVFAGRNQVIHDAGGALEALLKADAELVAGLGASSARWRPTFARKAKPVLKPFMESEINQQIAVLAAGRADAREIFERTSRAVSTEYVERTTASLRSIVRAVVGWERASFVGVVVLLTPWAYLGLRLLLDAKELPAVVLPQTRVPIFEGDAPRDYVWAAAAAVLVAVIAGPLHRLRARAWFTRVGGDHLLRFATAQGHIVGKWVAMLAIILGFAGAAAKAQKIPAWLDSEGRVYGVLKVREPAVAPAPPPAPKAVPKRGQKQPAAPK